MSHETNSTYSEEYSCSSNAHSTSSHAIYLPREDSLSAVLAKVSELFDHPMKCNLSEGVRLDTVMAHQPHMSGQSLSCLTRGGPTPVGSDSSFDICTYYTGEAFGDEISSSISSADIFMAADGEYESVFNKMFDKLANDNLVIDEHLQLLRREAPLRRLMKIARMEIRQDSAINNRSHPIFAEGDYDSLPSPAAGLFQCSSVSQKLYQTPVRSRPQPFYGVSNSPFSPYVCFASSDTYESIFKDGDRDIFDDGASCFSEPRLLNHITFGKVNRPRFYLLKKFIKKVLATKARSDFSCGPRDGDLSTDDRSSSTGSFSGWTSIYLPPSLLRSPMLTDE